MTDAGVRPSPEGVSEQLQVAVAELQVANAELEAQQREIDELLAREQDARGRLGALMATVPLAVLTTDADGAVVDANQAAGALLGVMAGRLSRKPVHAYVAVADRQRLRTAVAGTTAGEAASLRVLLTPRGGEPVECDVTVRAGDPAAPVPLLHWVLVPAGSSGPGAQEGPVQALAELCRLPVADVSPHELLVRIAGLAARAVTAADWCSVTLGDPAQPDDTASDSGRAQRVDGAQWRTGEGPCATAWRVGAPVVAADVRRDERWPRLAASVAGDGVAAALAVPVLLEGRPAGVLNLYSARPGGLDDERHLDRALVFAEAVAAVLRDARRTEELRTTAAQLQEAMRSRAGIEQAKGVVAAWLGCSVEEAFAVLSAVSQDRNVKLRDLAALVVGDAPTSGSLRELLGRQRERLSRRPARERSVDVRRPQPAHRRPAGP